MGSLGETGPAGPPGPDGLTSLVRITNLPIDDGDCAGGGLKVESGIDVESRWLARPERDRSDVVRLPADGSQACRVS